MSKLLSLQTSVQSHKSSNSRTSYVKNGTKISRRTSSLSLPNKYGIQLNPAAAGLFGIAGLEAVEAATLGLTAAQSVAMVAQQSGKLSYQPVKASRLMNKEPNPYTRKYTHSIFGAGSEKGGLIDAAQVTFELLVDSNDFGEIIAYIKHNLAGSSNFDYSSLNATFTNLGMYPRGGGEKDPRAWPIRFAYQGQYDVVGNGKWDFQGEFEFNAFGYFKNLKHKVVDRSLITSANFGKPENFVYKYRDNLNYKIPKLPSAQRKVLEENYKNDPNYKGKK